MSDGEKVVLRRKDKQRDSLTVEEPKDAKRSSVKLSVKYFESIGRRTENRSVMLLGKTGCGKSTLGNFLVGGKTFFVAKGAQWGSVTVKSMDATITHNDRELHVVDTPGFCDTDMNKREENLEEIASGLLRARKGVHAVIICNSVQSRFSDEERVTLQTLEQLENLWDHAMVIFTNAGRLGDTNDEQEKMLKSSLDDPNCPEGMKTLMQKVKNRYVLVESVKPPQDSYHGQKLTEVFTMIDKICNDNHDRKYNNRLFKLAMKHFDDAKTKMLQEKEHAEANQTEQLQEKGNEEGVQQAKTTSQTEETQPPKTSEVEKQTKDLTDAMVLATMTSVENPADTSSNDEDSDLEKQVEKMASKPFKEELRKDAFIETYLIKPHKKPFAKVVEAKNAVIDTICSVM